MGALLNGIANWRIYDLAQPMVNGMTCSPNHPGFRMALLRRHGDSERADGTSAASEIIVTGGHVGTHIDAFAHFSDHGRLHGGVSAAEAQNMGRFTSHGVDTIVPIASRGILLDVAAAAGKDLLSAGVPVDPELLVRAASNADKTIEAGDVVLVRTGWSHFFADSEKFLGRKDGAPGITTDAARWLADQGVIAIGADTTSVEHIPAGQGHALLPVHKLLLVERGVHLIEMLALDRLASDKIFEFLFVAAPLKIVGATGSPLRPLALVE
jgi:kynurenine formamidase